MSERHIENVLEASLLAAGRALKLDELMKPFLAENVTPERSELRAALVRLAESLEGRGIELVEVASGFRLQVRSSYSQQIAALFSERPPRYSRALLETLALIAYRQPITRGEIEDIRGVAVSTNVIRTLLEREWVRVLGHREVPGRPALYGTTATFLDYFGLKSLEQLPPLAELRDPDLPSGDLFAPLVAAEVETSSGEISTEDIAAESPASDVSAADASEPEETVSEATVGEETPSEEIAAEKTPPEETATEVSAAEQTSADDSMARAEVSAAMPGEDRVDLAATVRDSPERDADEVSTPDSSADARDVLGTHDARVANEPPHNDDPDATDVAERER
ncbi:MAG: SMC-Scp complex subunit ScpB [Gammaproteobacteria bacterium]|nr:SMC-Scp complex subunit ScpB [Gammaproteobacteria bacterium]